MPIDSTTPPGDYVEETIKWGGRQWRKGDLGRFKAFLRRHGTSYAKWAKSHAAAAEFFGTTTDTPDDDPATPAEPQLDPDIANMFPGLPPEVAAEVFKIFKNGGSAAQAIAYIRGTQWHKDTFVGFQEGFKFGLFGDEAGWRQYENAAQLYYKQYLNRNADKNEIGAWIRLGLNPVTVGQKIAGQAWTGSLSAQEAQQLLGQFGSGRLDQSGLLALGEQQAGLDSAVGSSIARQLDLAQRRAQRIFEGALASPSLQIGGAGLSAPSLSPRQKPDIGA